MCLLAQSIGSLLHPSDPRLSNHILFPKNPTSVSGMYSSGLVYPVEKSTDHDEIDQVHAESTLCNRIAGQFLL